MRATKKYLSGLLVAFVAVFPFVEANCAPFAKILSVDTQKVFERYNEAQEALQLMVRLLPLLIKG